MPASQTVPETFVYELDAEDRIQAVNDAWDTFAQDNGAPDLAREEVVGMALWRFINDPHTVDLYRLLLDRLRHTGRTIEFDYRCDSPDCRRFLHMKVEPLDNGGVRFISRLDRTEPRPAVQALDPNLPRHPGVLSMCSICKRVRSAQQDWVPIEEALKSSETMQRDRPPSVAQGVCPDCSQLIRNQCEQMAKDAKNMFDDLRSQSR